ncbi:MAG: NUDIX domain-containing protein [bacterium]|jgi:predicted NUDIX family NTP pyrophosphohydrolase
MARQSAGIVLYRWSSGALEVFLVHPGGPFWRNKDHHAWSIPKGEFSEGEDAFQVALREFQEETGQTIDGNFIPLKPIRQTGGKIVRAWAVEGDCDAENITSNTFTIIHPPKSGQYKTFPEIDRASWFPIQLAKEKIVKGQIALLDELVNTVT